MTPLPITEASETTRRAEAGPLPLLTEVDQDGQGGVQSGLRYERLLQPELLGVSTATKSNVPSSPMEIGNVGLQEVADTPDPLTGLKKDVVEILSSCEGHCLNICQFVHEYKRRFGRKFQRPKGKKMKTVMDELDDIIYLEKSKNGAWIMKLKVTNVQSQDTKEEKSTIVADGANMIGVPVIPPPLLGKDVEKSKGEII